MSDQPDIMAPEDTTIRWFGPRQPLHHDERTQIPTPLAQPCLLCEELFVEGDQGITIPLVRQNHEPVQMPYHRSCFLKSVLEPEDGDC